MAERRGEAWWLREYWPLMALCRAAGLEVGLGPAWLGRLHTLVVVVLMLALALLTATRVGLDGLEDSTHANVAIDRIKTLIGSAVGAGCCLLSLSQRRQLRPIMAQLDRPRRLSSRPVLLRSLALSLFLLANSLYEIFYLNTSYKLLDYSYLVEYYSLLVVQAMEYEFVGLVRTLSAMLADLRTEMLTSRRKNPTSWIHSHHRIARLSTRTAAIFGPSLFLGFLANFVTVLNNLYFSVMYQVRKYSELIAVPPSVLMYLNLNIYIFLRLFEVLSAAHDLRKKEKEYTMDFENYVLHDATRRLVKDVRVESQIVGWEELLPPAGYVLPLEYSLLTDMAGAWATFLVALLQFQLKPCQIEGISPTTTAANRSKLLQ